MSGSKAKTSSKNDTKTSTTQQDQRVAAADQAIAIGSGTSGEITINQASPELLQGVSTIINRAFDEVTASREVATNAGEAAVVAQAARADSTRQIVIMGLVGLVVLAMIMKGKHS